MENGKPKLVIAADRKILFTEFRKYLKPMDLVLKELSLPELEKKLPEESPDAILLLIEKQRDMKEEYFHAVKKYDDNLPVLLVGNAKKVEDVVRIMKLGIYDYFTFPPNVPQLQMAVQNAFRMYQLTKRLFLLENRLGFQTKLDEMIGSSAMMQTIFETIKTVAKTNATVLVTGESGTGKELVAKALHRISSRADRHFIDINCAAIPKELLENELFGHERGAYTGADKRYIGCCERADGGTLFLDEISELAPSLQVKLLRFLQERCFCRVGGDGPISVDVRIVAATNRDLSKEVEAKRFRKDLFYRINVVHIAIPPLRDRKEDIPGLAKHFLEKFRLKNDKVFLDFTPEAMEALVQYNWPGNIRELENCIERAVVLHNDTKIKRKHLPEVILRKSFSKEEVVPPKPPPERGKILPLDMIERYAIEAALKASTGNVAKAATQLKIGQATLYRKIKLYGIRI